MRQRLEDLGRIGVLIDNLLEHPLFQENRGEKDHFCGWFNQQPFNRQMEILATFNANLNSLEGHLRKILEIALGEDDLNGN